MPHRLIINGELILYGVVGGGFFFEDGFTAAEVVAALGEMSGDITVRINSGGGFAWDGIAIHNAIRAHNGRITIKVDAIAASAASIILMAGDRRVVPPSATIMIHNASGFTVGTAKDHAKTAEILQKLDGQMAQLYAAATDNKAARIKQLMDDETWMTGEEAVEEGFADEAPTDAAPAQAAMFDYRIYAHAPEHLKKLVASFDRPQFKNAPAAAGRSPRGSQPAALNPGDPEESFMTTDTKTPAKVPDAAAAGQTETAALKPAIAAVVAVTETPEQIAARATGAERKRSADITAACQIAGKPEKASAFIAEGKSLSEVVEALQADRSPGKGKPADEINQRHANAGKPENPADLNPAAIYAARAKARSASALRS